MNIQFFSKFLLDCIFRQFVPSLIVVVHLCRGVIARSVIARSVGRQLWTTELYVTHTFN